LNYKTIEDLNKDIKALVPKLPPDLDLIVGVPRSGLLAANMLALYLNLPLTDVDGLCERRVFETGLYRKFGKFFDFSRCKKVLVIDDSINSGASIKKVKSAIQRANLPYETYYAAVYVTPASCEFVDFWCEAVDQPRCFEWNVMHHPNLERSCVDLDGILCRDPSDYENDDGENYRHFLINVEPLFKPSVEIGWIVTCRLEKYRDLTEEWLKKHSIRYRSLVMMDLPDKKTRLALGNHALFKAEVYKSTDAMLFIESSFNQAQEIARISGKEVLCIETNQIVQRENIQGKETEFEHDYNPEYAAPEFYCPFCEKHATEFLPTGLDIPVLKEKNVVGGGYRLNAMCPHCHSTDRERLIYLYLRNKKDYLFCKNLKLLHVAPEGNLQRVLMAKPNIEYLSADLSSPLATVQMDITDIKYEDNSFDVVICNHVLEHIPDDRKAMAELYRVLKPGGWAILQVPISLSLDQTFEDPLVTTPEEREKVFGQSDHVRIYAKDYTDRLEEVGFSVEVYSFAGEFGESAIRKYGLLKDENIYIFSKPGLGEEFKQDVEYKEDDTLRSRFKLLSHLIEGQKVLEIGCGNGDLSLEIAKLGFDVIGIDISEPGICQAVELVQKENLDARAKFMVMDATSLEFPDNSFDTVLIAEVLEHVRDSRKLLEEAVRVVRNGGRVIVSVPDGLLIPFQGHLRVFFKDTLTTELSQYAEEITWHELPFKKWLICSFFVKKPELDITEGPLVDILMPTYNGRKYIKNAIKSVINQTYRNWNLVVVNDGGEDVADIIDEFHDSRIKYIVAEHKGKAHALNIGIENSNGEFIGYLDDDDILYPIHLEVLVKAALEDNKDFVYSDWYEVSLDENNKEIGREFQYRLDVAPWMLIPQNYINHKCILHNRSLFKKAGLYDEALDILIDWDMIRRLFFISPAYHVWSVTSERIVYYKQNMVENRITGLWQREPVRAGTSWQRIIGKTVELSATEEALKEAIVNLMLSYYHPKLDAKDTQIANLATAVQERDSQIAELNNNLQAKDSQISSLESTLQEKVSQISNLQAGLQEKVSQISNLEMQLQQIQRGIVMQLVSRYQRVVEKLLRSGTRSRYYYELGLTGIRVILNEGWRAFVRKARNWLQPEIRLLNCVSKKVSVVIPNYNGKRYLGECIESLYRMDFRRDDYEIIVIDNASLDGSKEFVLANYPSVRLIQAGRNLGFAGGCNLGIRHSNGEYVVLLNNDTTVDTAWLRELVATADSDPDIGIVGSKLVFMHNPGEIQNAGNYITTCGDGGDIGFHEPDICQYDTVRETMAVCGASMLVKRKLIEEIGAFDEDFFIYWEDADFCYRARLYGKKIIFNPKSVVHHVHAATSQEWSPFFTFCAFRNKLLIHLKNSPLQFFLKVLFLYCGQVVIETLVKRVNRRTHLRIISSFAKKFFKFLIKRLWIRFIIKTEDDARVMLRLTRVRPKIDGSMVKKVCVYNAFLPTMGGGENHTAHVIEYINMLFPCASVDILCHETQVFSKSDFDGRDFVHMLEKDFHVSLKNAQIRFVPVGVNSKSLISNLIRIRKLSSISREYDIFINNTFASSLPAQGKINIYCCMFPQKLDYPTNPLLRLPIKWFSYRFLKSYHLFLANSHYTQCWMDKYWGVNSYVLSQPIQQRKTSVNLHRHNVIINVGRFFAGGHNKRQDVMIKAFIEVFNRGWVKDWKLILIGRKHVSEASCRFVESLERLARDYPIELRHDISSDELDHLLDTSKIYWHATGFGEDPNLHPEKFEHLGISTVEAMHFGVVPVVFNAGGQAELIDHGQNGFLWNTIDELVNYTKLLVEDDHLREQLSESAFAFSRTFVTERRLGQLRWFLTPYYEWE